MVDISKRRLLKSGLLAACVPAGVLPLVTCRRDDRADFSLQAADDNGVRLPVGFSSRIVARSGEPPLDSVNFIWHDAPDGAACVPTDDGGWVYVSNSEIGFWLGGASALRFDMQGQLVDAYSILQGTNRNCAGGSTPWKTWLSCEEVDKGQVWECDPLGAISAVVRPSLGRFKHEAVAVDPIRNQLYLTEDEPDGGLYRFTPDTYPDLENGTLEVATDDAVDRLSWLPVADPEAKIMRTRYQQPDMRRFDGGEGIVYHDGMVYFTTKGDDVVWEYDVTSHGIRKLYDDDDFAKPVLTGVDNITAYEHTNGQARLYVAEDGGDLQVVVVDLTGQVTPIAQLVGHDRSEIAGVAFSPDGTRLYFSSQRGLTGDSTGGITFEITGPFV